MKVLTDKKTQSLNESVQPSVLHWPIAESGIKRSPVHVKSRYKLRNAPSVNRRGIRRHQSERRYLNWAIVDLPRIVFFSPKASIIKAFFDVKIDSSWITIFWI